MWTLLRVDDALASNIILFTFIVLFVKTFKKNQRMSCMTMARLYVCHDEGLSITVC